LNEEISLPELYLPSLGLNSLLWMQIKYTGNQGVLIPGFCFPNFIKTQKFSQEMARASK
jgi:hypothetical protein